MMFVIILINLSRTEYAIYLQKKQRKTRVDKCMCLHHEQSSERVCAKQYRERKNQDHVSLSLFSCFWYLLSLCLQDCFMALLLSVSVYHLNLVTTPNISSCNYDAFVLAVLCFFFLKMMIDLRHRLLYRLRQRKVVRFQREGCK